MQRTSDNADCARPAVNKPGYAGKTGYTGTQGNHVHRDAGETRVRRENQVHMDAGETWVRRENPGTQGKTGYIGYTGKHSYSYIYIFLRFRSTVPYLLWFHCTVVVLTIYSIPVVVCCYLV